jgi:hypothetical protein
MAIFKWPLRLFGLSIAAEILDLAIFLGCSIEGAHFNLEIGMLEQLKGRTFKILKIMNW